jgi:hypothetical protein
VEGGEHLSREYPDAGGDELCGHDRLEGQDGSHLEHGPGLGPEACQAVGDP